MDTPDRDRIDMALRWRLVLGRYAEDALSLEREDGEDGEDGGSDGPGEASRIDQTLEYIYDREFAARAHRDAGRGDGDGLTVPAWLSGVRELFPAEAVAVIEKDALQRYGMTELVTDAELLRRTEPSPQLLQAILQFKHLMKPDVLAVARDLVRQVVDDLAARIRRQCEPSLWGPSSGSDHPPSRTFRNVDWHRTIRRNLRNWDIDRGRLVADRISYRPRQRQRARWRVVIAVDQSGSMLDSLVHSAIMAAIFATLPGVHSHLVLWDHRVVDVSDIAHDPLEVLMGAQLGGGTLLTPALRHCASLITEPDRTILVVVSDFFVFGEAREALDLASELSEAGVHGIGLCALDSHSKPAHNEKFARALVEAGWFVAALTPKRLAEHVGGLLG